MVDLLGRLRQPAAALGHFLGHGLVDGRGQEGGAEDDHADRAGDEGGSDVLLRKTTVHVAMVYSERAPETSYA